MRSILAAILLLSAVFGFPQLLRAQTPTAPDEKHATKPPKRGGIFTLYALDPLARNLCFTDGKEGLEFVNNKWENRCSDLSYTLAGGGSLVTGFEVNRSGAIIDLGTVNDLRRYGYEDAEGGGVGFASLRLDEGKVTILRADNGKEKPVWQPLQEAIQLAETKPSANAPIKLGHVYLVRIVDSRDKSFQQLVKLIVISYRPDEAVTVRWELL